MGNFIFSKLILMGGKITLVQLMQLGASEFTLSCGYLHKITFKQ